MTLSHLGNRCIPNWQSNENRKADEAHRLPCFPMFIHLYFSCVLDSRCVIEVREHFSDNSADHAVTRVHSACCIIFQYDLQALLPSDNKPNYS